MKEFYLENDCLKVTIFSKGAELASIYDKEKERELLWNGDEKYWPRRAPVLFPFVGIVNHKQYKYEGTSYPMTQHGFARDMEFECLPDSREGQLWFRLHSDETTLEKYPFPFILDIGYELTERELKVLWKVSNPGEDIMYFSIGAHPGFMCPVKSDEKQTDYFIDLHMDGNLSYNLISHDGLVGIYNETLPLDNGRLPIDAHLFDRDALIVEGGQTHEVSLLNGKKEPYITVAFDAPLFGLWSPAGKNAPFVCIEPWYGRCDAEDFEGTLEERAYEQKLDPKETFEKSYMIKIH